MQPQPPYIPRPRTDDDEYMKVCHRFLQSSIDNYQLQRERNTWRSAFYAVTAVLGVIVFTLLVVCVLLYNPL